MIVRLPSSGDSAGQPWAGRHFEATAYDGDDGRADEQLLDALLRFRAGTGRASSVLQALGTARLLVPLLAHAGETGVDDQGRTIDKTQELSIVTVEAPDGRTALPVFTSTETLSAWNPRARPIPTAARRVALAAAGEGTDLLVLDPTSPTEFAVRRPALWALAQGEEPPVPPVTDPTLLAVFTDSTATEPAVAELALTDGDPEHRLRAAEVTVELTLAPGLDKQALDALLTRLQNRWSSSELIAARVDSLAIRLQGTTQPRA